jgi:hypothetical protein
MSIIKHVRFHRTNWKFHTSGGGIASLVYFAGGGGNFQLINKENDIKYKFTYAAVGGGLGFDPVKVFHLIEEVLPGFSFSLESFPVRGRILAPPWMGHTLSSKYFKHTFLLFSIDASAGFGISGSIFVFPKHSVYSLLPGGLHGLVMPLNVFEIAAVAYVGGLSVGGLGAGISATIGKTFKTKKYPPK